MQVGERKCRLGPGDVGLLWGGVRQQRPQALGVRGAPLAFAPPPPIASQA